MREGSRDISLGGRSGGPGRTTVAHQYCQDCRGFRWYFFSGTESERTGWNACEDVEQEQRVEGMTMLEARKESFEWRDVVFQAFHAWRFPSVGPFDKETWHHESVEGAFAYLLSHLYRSSCVDGVPRGNHLREKVKSPEACSEKTGFEHACVLPNGVCVVKDVRDFDACSNLLSEYI